MEPPSEDLRRYQTKSRAAALFSQLPDHDLGEAREILLEFLRLARDAGLKVDDPDPDKSAPVVRLR